VGGQGQGGWGIACAFPFCVGFGQWSGWGIYGTLDRVEMGVYGCGSPGGIAESVGGASGSGLVCCGGGWWVFRHAWRGWYSADMYVCREGLEDGGGLMGVVALAGAGFCVLIVGVNAYIFLGSLFLLVQFRFNFFRGGGVGGGVYYLDVFWALCGCFN